MSPAARVDLAKRALAAHACRDDLQRPIASAIASWYVGADAVGVDAAAPADDDGVPADDDEPEDRAAGAALSTKRRIIYNNMIASGTFPFMGLDPLRTPTPPAGPRLDPNWVSLGSN